VIRVILLLAVAAGVAAAAYNGGSGDGAAVWSGVLVGGLVYLVLAVARGVWHAGDTRPAAPPAESRRLTVAPEIPAGTGLWGLLWLLVARRGRRP